jgi:hypothetical protein
MEFTYFPVDITQLPATITFLELGEGIHETGGARVVAEYLNHPAMTLGYRIEADDAVLVYLCDHEPFSETFSHDSRAHLDADDIAHEGDRRHARFMGGAGLVIHDAQYTPEEYADVLANQYAQQLRALYNNGARKVALMGVGQVGCSPNELAQQSPDGVTCVERINSAIEIFNQKVVNLVDQFNTLPGAHFTYINAYGIFQDILRSPGSHGN